MGKASLDDVSTDGTNLGLTADSKWLSKKFQKKGEINVFIDRPDAHTNPNVYFIAGLTLFSHRLIAGGDEDKILTLSQDVLVFFSLDM